MRYRQITIWKRNTDTIDLNNGRWVQLGKPSLVKFFLTGLPGGKCEFQRKFPYIRYEKNKLKYDNHLTLSIKSEHLEWPSGLGVDGWIKGLFGQRRIKGI